MEEDKFYFEKIYKNKKFKFEEDSYIVNKILKLKKRGSILDLGCGEGGNSIFLAERGFKVTLVDISKTAIKKIKNELNKRNIKAEIICKDLNNFHINKNFDVIISLAVFHFLNRKKTINLIKEMKKRTNKAGVNIIVGFLDNTSGKTSSFYLKKNELKKLYSDWKILEYKEYKERDEEGINSLARIIAIKK